MKKIYSTPNIRAIDLDLDLLIATSFPVDDNTEDPENSLSREMTTGSSSTNLWDNEW